MKHFFLLLLIAFGATSVSFAQLTKTYTNDRFGFSIKYPAQMVADPPPQNGDGQSWRSADGQAEFATWGSPIIKLDTVLDEQIFMATQDRQVTLRRLKNGPKDPVKFFVVSGYQADGRIFYRKTILVKADPKKADSYDHIKSFEIVYPQNQRNPYDKIVTEIGRAFVK